jgi:hypothetical protein
MEARFSAFLIGLILLSTWNEAGAQFHDGEFDEKSWVEQQAQLPSFPKTEDLIKIPMVNMGSFEVAIDPRSIDNGKDGVVRYVLIAKSNSGSENVSFEGIRCESRERKLYAIGKRDKTWAQVRNPAWTNYGANPHSYHFELANEYFCPDLKIVMTVTEALKNLKEGGVRRRQQPGSPE